MPSLSDVVENFDHQTFPPLLPLTVRLYTILFGTSDASFRFFGFAVGVAFICVVWLIARVVGKGVPLVLLTLLGLNTTFLVWGTTVGGYGIGSVLIVLALGLTARSLLQPAPWRIVAALFACLASVQFVINDLVLVSVIAFSAVAACLICRFVRLALVFAGVGLCCVTSDLVYLKIYSGADWRIVLRQPVPFLWLWDSFRVAVGNPISIIPWLWGLIFSATLLGAACYLIINWRRRPVRESLVLLFAALVSLTAPLGYYGSLRLLRYPTNVWHYLPLLSLFAANSDLILAQLCRIHWVRVVRLGFVFALLIILPFAAWPQATERQTNIDIVAQELERDASTNDVIVINPWFVGISFGWYYHGPTRWLTVPIVSEHRIHRFDLVKAKMMAPYPLSDLEQEMNATLRAAHRVWLVGSVQILPEGQAPLSLPPAPQSEFSWQNYAYQYAWSQQLGAFIRQHAVRVTLVLPPMRAVNKVENAELWAAEGWRD